MDWLTIIGLVAATCTTAALLPQVMKTVRTRQTRDISLLMYSLFTVGIVLWLIYGLMLNNVPLIAANSITLVLATAVLLLKIKYG